MFFIGFAVDDNQWWLIPVESVQQAEGVVVAYLVWSSCRLTPVSRQYVAFHRMEKYLYSMSARSVDNIIFQL